MKTIYLLVVAAGFLSASCQDDAADVQPAYAVNETPLLGAKPETVEPIDLFTTSTWSVDTLSKIVYARGASVSDSMFTYYGNYQFKQAAPNGNSRQAEGPQTLIHVHADWNGAMVADTLSYCFGNYDAGIPSNNLLTVWKGDAITAHKIVFSRVWSTKQAQKYQSIVVSRNAQGEDETTVRSFTIRRR